MATDVEIAWAAGLFEGEGSLPRDNKDPLNLRASLAMVDEDVVRRFHSVVGCGVVKRRLPRDPRHQIQWHWKAGAVGDVAHLLALFRPYLGQRRLGRVKEMDAALEAIRTSRVATCSWCGKEHIRGPRVSDPTETRYKHRFCSAKCQWSHANFKKRKKGVGAGQLSL